MNIKSPKSVSLQQSQSGIQHYDIPQTNLVRYIT